jgi:phospholipase/carboxylesterase
MMLRKQSEKLPLVHQGQSLLVTGESIENAQAAMIMIHGRGATAENILSLANELDQTGFTFLAPQAANYTWYPYGFMAPIEDNEPEISSALQVIDDIFQNLESKGIPPERTILFGFSQGACLATEYAAQNAKRFGGLIGLSGGLIGPEGTSRDYSGSLENTPVFLGCSDIDPHIPKERVEETTRILEELNGEVTHQFYPNMGHTINQDEIEHVKNFMKKLTS